MMRCAHLVLPIAIVLVGVFVANAYMYDGPAEAAGKSAVGSSCRLRTAAQERTLKSKDTFKECDTCPEMVVVAAGSFTMGSPASDKDRSLDEGPQHRVTFSKQFAVGKFAITFDEWDACVDD